MRSAVRRIRSSCGILQTTTLSHDSTGTHLLGASFSTCLHNNNNNAENQQRRHYSTRLAEVGRFEDKLADESCYPAGQPFLHRIFGYRGVTLFPWLARVHDVDLRKQYSETSGTPITVSGASHELDESHHRPRHHRDKGYSDESKTKPSSDDKAPVSAADDDDADARHFGSFTFEQEGGRSEQPAETPSSALDDGAHKFTNPRSTRFHPYYQVLIDTRDCPFVSNRTQTEAVTFLGHPDNSKSVYSIKGLDYVAHEDILPYTSVEEQPIRHELHKKLFRYDSEAPPGSPKYLPSDLLDSWRNKHPWLELSRVYKETTESVRVTVIPFYLGHTTIEDTSFHWWRYCVRLENFNDMAIQLRERHWKIFSQTNMLQTIKGRGVVGVEPLLTRSEPAYQYSSHVNLQDKSGHMWGTFKMQREDGYTFECRIPPFSLESSLSTSPNSSNTSAAA